jgi:hypothetical protein
MPTLVVVRESFFLLVIVLFFLRITTKPLVPSNFLYDISTILDVCLMVFNATFNNISVISWRPVLVVEESDYPERTTDHGQATGKLYHLRLRVEFTLFVDYKAEREPTPYW